MGWLDHVMRTKHGMMRVNDAMRRIQDVIHRRLVQIVWMRGRTCPAVVRMRSIEPYYQHHDPRASLPIDGSIVFTPSCKAGAELYSRIYTLLPLHMSQISQCTLESLVVYPDILSNLRRPGTSLRFVDGRRSTLWSTPVRSSPRNGRSHRRSSWCYAWPRKTRTRKAWTTGH